MDKTTKKTIIDFSPTKIEISLVLDFKYRMQNANIPYKDVCMIFRMPRTIA